MIPNSRSAPVPEHATTTELTRLLFGPDRDRVHRPWRDLVADPRMHRRPEDPVAEQLAASYRRLQAVNASVDAAALAASPEQLAAMHEWTGPADGALTVLSGIHYNLFLGSLLDHDASPKRPLDAYLRMERTGTFLCTELGHGNDATALETTADYDRTGRTFTLHTPAPAAAKFMPNTGPTGGAKTAVVTARLRVGGRDQGIFLFLTPLTDETGHPLPGVTVHPLPQRPGSPVDHCLTSFDHLVLPFEALLTGAHGRLSDDGTVSSALGSKRKRFLAAIGRVTAGKLCMSAGAIGGARAALATAVRYSQHRRVAGTRPDRRVPLWAHRTHHGPLLHGLATVYAMTALHRRSLADWLAHDPAAPAEREAAERQVAVTKGWNTWQARELILESRERCGAQGLLPVNGLTALAADIEGTITAEGDNLALWAKAGAELLLADDALDTPDAPDAPDAGDTETSPADGGSAPPAPNAAGPAHHSLRDPAGRQALLAAAGRHHLGRARALLRETPVGEAIGRWNAAAPDALAAVTARAEHDAGAALLAWAEAAAEPTARSLLADLHRLFTLERIDRHATGLLATGALTPRQAAELPALRERSLTRLAGHALPLVDAFDLPEPLLARLPIATPAYQEAFTV